VSGPKDIPLGSVGELRLVGVVSSSEQERCAKLREHFDAFLSDFLQRVLVGVRYSPGVNRELVSSFMMWGAAAALSDPRIPDELIERHTKAFIEEALQLLEVHARAQLAEAGVDTGAPA
jgi:hypothetical protein